MPEKNTNPKGGQDPEPNEGETPELVYETWIEEQPKEVKAMLVESNSGLKTALDSERERSKKLEKDLRDAAKQLEEGSEARTQLESMADQMAVVEKERNFYDLAHKAGAKNLRLAYLAANDAELVRADGSADFAALKEKSPELFGTAPPPKGRQGDGTNSDTPPTANMNSFIRRSAGREPNQN